MRISARKLFNIEGVAARLSTAPFAGLVCALATGILLGRYTLGWAAVCICAVCALAGAVYMWPRGKGGKRWLRMYEQRNSLWLFVLPLTTAAGFTAIRLDCAPEQTQISENGPYAKGMVKDVELRTTGDVITVDVKSLLNEKGEETSVNPFGVRVYTGSTGAANGDIITFRLNTEDMEERGLSESHKEYMYARGIDFISHTEASLITITGRERGLRQIAQGWRDSLTELIEQGGTERETTAFMCAFLIGEKRDMEQETLDTFAGAGIAHILALSGLHVGILALILTVMLYPLDLTGSRTPRYMATGVCIALFALATGLGASVMRASIMSIALLTGAIIQRRGAWLNVLCAAGFLILMATPRALFDAGFRLSFVCTLGIGAGARLLSVWERGKKRGMKQKLLRPIALTVTVFIVSWPLTAYLFGKVSLLFLPLNIVIVPLLPIFMITAVCYVGLSALGIAPKSLTDITDGMYHIIAKSAEAVSELPGADVTIYMSGTGLWLYLTAIAFLMYMLVSGSRRAFACSAVCAAGALCVTLMYDAGRREEEGVSIYPRYDRCEIVEYRHGESPTVRQAVDGDVECIRQRGMSIVWIDRALHYENGKNGKFRCHTLVIGPMFKGNMADILRHFSPQAVVIHAAVEDNLCAELKEDASALNMSVHDLHTDGEYRIN